jgi:hypothetical protein
MPDDGYYLPALSPLPSRFDVARQKMLSTLAEFFTSAPDAAKVETGTTIRALQQIAVLLAGARP